MRFKCLFRDPVAVSRVVDFEADSIDAALDGIHDKCRTVIDLAENAVIQGKLFVDPEYLITESLDHYRLLYRPADGSDTPNLMLADDVLYMESLQ